MSKFKSGDLVKAVYLNGKSVDKIWTVEAYDKNQPNFILLKEFANYTLSPPPSFPERYFRLLTLEEYEVYNSPLRKALNEI